MSKDAYYFPHDSNAIDDPKIMIMVSEMGLESYAIYWIIIEHLRQQPDFISHIKILKPLSLRHGSSDAKFYTVVNQYGLFIVDENNFFSPSLIQRMQPYIARQLAGKKAGLASGIARNERSLNDGSTKRVKESKVKESKVKERVENTPPRSDAAREALSKTLSFFSVPPKTTKEKDKWTAELEKLHEIDKIDYSKMTAVIIATRQDDFWAKNFMSIMKLRRKNKDGVMYYHVFAEATQKATRKFKTTENQGFY